MCCHMGQCQNGKAERMIRTIKRSIGNVAQDGTDEWAHIVNKVVFGYRRGAIRDGRGLFEIIYTVPSTCCQQTTSLVDTVGYQLEK